MIMISSTSRSASTRLLLTSAAFLLIAVAFRQETAVTTTVAAFSFGQLQTSKTSSSRTRSYMPPTRLFVASRKKDTNANVNTEEEVEEEEEILSQEDLSVLFERDEQDENDDENDDEDDDDDSYGESSHENSAKSRGKQRWQNLHPKLKQKLIKQGQERAIANKKKNEPVQVKKRRLMMFMKEQQRKKKLAAKVERPLSVQDPNRKPLADLEIDSEVEGTVISLTPFGAYVDVGSECDGLLHVSQLSNTVFVEHPRQLLSPGEGITVRIRSVNPDRKKLHLTMLPLEVLQEEKEKSNEMQDRIALDDLAPDDELWGEIRRVTDFGAYIEVGAQADGWLHFMEHPLWEVGQHPTEFMNVGERVRVWVSDVDVKQNRLKLTAVRPSHLPGPRREFL